MKIPSWIYKKYSFRECVIKIIFYFVFIVLWILIMENI